ncbi:hypothetical protein BY458DRAFT_488491 [Sporodiniella umbellata]|nr:hypothetical protein BY458DRAFT_488491 [Sporodiniella umbellata]
MNSCPEEVLILIFGYYIESVDDLKIIESVCKRFERIANSLYLWYSLFKKIYPKWSDGLKFSLKKQPLIDWKEFMIERENVHLEQVYFHSKKYQMQEPFVHDIDPVTRKGMIGVSFYREFDKKRRILFYNYPSFKLVRKYSPCLPTYAERDYQLLSIQSIKYQNEYMKIFTIALLWPLRFDLLEGDQENERASTWDSLLIYRIHDNGSIQCISECNQLKRDFFVEDELPITHRWFNARSNTIYMLVFGINTDFLGHRYIFELDLKHTIKDPLMGEANWLMQRPCIARLVSSAYLENQVSCMIRFSPLPLRHLICVGSIDSNELSLYDWRSGTRVGQVDWDEEVQPSNFDFMYTLPLPTSEKDIACEYLANYGPRLVVAGIREQSLFEIRVLDVTHLMQKCCELYNSLTETNILNQNWKTVYVYLPGECEDYSAYSIFQTSLYLLTEKGHLLVIDIESGKLIKEEVIGPGVDINVLGGKDVVVTKQHGLLLLK